MGLKQARFGKQGDRFLGFWLSLVIDSRHEAPRLALRQARATVSAFVHETSEALATAGPDAYYAELQDAATVYFSTTLTDPTYSSTMFGLKRLTSQQLHAKIARETAQVAALLTTLEDADPPMAAAWVKGYREAIPEGETLLRQALASQPGTAALLPD